MERLPPSAHTPTPGRRLRDDSRSVSEVLRHLQRENDYADAVAACYATVEHGRHGVAPMFVYNWLVILLRGWDAASVL